MATVLPFDAAGIHLDPAQGLARQLYAALRERILDGRLGSRTRMPASRELAQALKVSRNTVVRAYEQLHAEGYIDGRTGDGTYVAELQEIPGRAPAVAPSAPLSAEGVGLGLHLARSVVRLHENHGLTGSLSLANGPGAVLVLRLPR